MNMAPRPLYWCTAIGLMFGAHASGQEGETAPVDESLLATVTVLVRGVPPDTDEPMEIGRATVRIEVEDHAEERNTKTGGKAVFVRACGRCEHRRNRPGNGTSLDDRHVFANG